MKKTWPTYMQARLEATSKPAQLCKYKSLYNSTLLWGIAWIVTCTSYIHEKYTFTYIYYKPHSSSSDSSKYQIESSILLISDSGLLLAFYTTEQHILDLDKKTKLLSTLIEYTCTHDVLCTFWGICNGCWKSNPDKFHSGERMSQSVWSTGCSDYRGSNVVALQKFL